TAACGDARHLPSGQPDVFRDQDGRRVLELVRPLSNASGGDAGYSEWLRYGDELRRGRGRIAGSATRAVLRGRTLVAAVAMGRARPEHSAVNAGVLQGLYRFRGHGWVSASSHAEAEGTESPSLFLGSVCARR